MRNGELNLRAPPRQLEGEPEVELNGFAPNWRTTEDQLRTHPSAAKRLLLAEQLRRHESASGRS